MQEATTILTDGGILNKYKEDTNGIRPELALTLPTPADPVREAGGVC